METIFLEQWLHEEIRKKVREDDEFARFFGKENLSHITRADVESYQLFKLKKILSYVYDKSFYYQDVLSRNAINPEDITSLDDLAKIPLIEPEEVARNPYQFVCVSLGDIARVTTFTTSGTTGPQKRVFCTQGDIERMTNFMGAGMRSVASKDDVVQIILPTGSENNQADLLEAAVKKMGASSVKAGINRDNEEQIELIKKYHSTVLFAPTARMYRITQELLQKGYDLSTIGVKALFVTSGYLSETMRTRLQDVWNCDVHAHYGLTEMGLGVAVECHAHNGFHFNERDLLLEVVNPKTGEVLKDGSEGELVFTTLSREGMPLIRYRTHDIASLITEPCPCGAGTMLKFGKVNRRLESIVRIGDGDEVYPSLFDEVLYKIPQVVDYQVTLKQTDCKDDLVFVVEVTKIGDALQQEIRRVLVTFPLLQIKTASGRITEPKIDLVGLGQLKRSGRAKKLIIDNR